MPHQRHRRGICGECGHKSALRADGTPYRHYRVARAPGEPLYCPGSSRPAAHVQPPPMVRWKHEDGGEEGDIGPLWIYDVACGWVSRSQAQIIADTLNLPLEEM